MNHVIDIDSNAVDFIKKQGGVVTVRLSPRHGCCGGLANLAVAEPRHPDAPHHYQHHIQDSISIYIAPELAAQGLRIGVEGWWKLRHLYVDSVAIQ
ncbi:CC/Se motif family (seleno)protein [Vreelandella alkaliphila]